MSKLREKMQKNAFNQTEFDEAMKTFVNEFNKINNDLANFKQNFKTQILPKLDNPSEDYSFILTHLDNAFNELREVYNACEDEFFNK